MNGNSALTDEQAGREAFRRGGAEPDLASAGFDRGWRLEEHQVYTEGLKAKCDMDRMGRSLPNPFPLGSPAWRAWGEGFNDEGEMAG